MALKSDGEPNTLALTSILSPNPSTRERIALLNQQIIELKAQKKCYNKMIKERQQMIKKLRSKKINR